MTSAGRSCGYITLPLSAPSHSLLSPRNPGMWSQRSTTGAYTGYAVFQPLSFNGLTFLLLSRWDLTMGQRGQLDRIPVAHSGPVLSIDWVPPTTVLPGAVPVVRQSSASNWYGGPGAGFFEDILPSVPIASGASSSSDSDSVGPGWIVSGGMDRCVKVRPSNLHVWATTNRVDVVRQVWDLTPTETRHRAHHPTYTLHTSFPVRRVLFRPGYECELAVVSNADFGTGTEFGHNTTSPGSAGLTPGAVTPRAITAHLGANGGGDGTATPGGRSKGEGSDPVEIWDVRRGYIAKWVVTGSAVEGGVTGSSISLQMRQFDNDIETLSDGY